MKELVTEDMLAAPRPEGSWLEVQRDYPELAAVFLVVPSGEGVARSLVDLFERANERSSWSRVPDSDPRRGWPCEKMFIARTESISVRMRGSADLVVSGSKLALLVDDGTRRPVEGAWIRGFSQPRDYSGARATWDDVSLYETKAALVVAVTRVVDWDGGLDRNEVEVFESTDGGRSWAPYDRYDPRRREVSGLEASARYCSYEPFLCVSGR